MSRKSVFFNHWDFFACVSSVFFSEGSSVVSSWRVPHLPTSLVCHGCFGYAAHQPLVNRYIFWYRYLMHDMIKWDIYIKQLRRTSLKLKLWKIRWVHQWTNTWEACAPPTWCKQGVCLLILAVPRMIRHKISTCLSLLLAVSPDDSSAFRWVSEMSSDMSTINSITAARRRWSIRVNVCHEMALIKMFLSSPRKREREMLVIEHRESSTNSRECLAALFAVAPVFLTATAFWILLETHFDGSYSWIHFG